MKYLIGMAVLATTTPSIAQQAPEMPPVAAITETGAYADLAASSDAYEIESSKLALQHASNPDVRRFAEMMTSDHAKTTAEVKVAAKASNITMHGGPNPKHTSMLKDLRAADKARVERLYVDQQVLAHEEALALHQGYVARGENPRLRSVAAAAAPIVEAHLVEIRRIQTAMGGPGPVRR